MKITILALVAVVMLVAPALAVTLPEYEYTILDLGTLGGGTSGAAAVNAHGQVVGRSQVTGNSSTNAFGTVVSGPINPATDDFGNLGGSWCSGWGINDAGQVVGESETAAGDYRAFRTQLGVALTLTNRMGTFGGASSVARDINNKGQIVGWTHTPDGVSHPFRTSANVLVQATDDLGTLGGDGGSATSINSSGQVVGTSRLPGDGARRAFRTAPNSVINPATDNLGTIGDLESIALDINDVGQVVGYCPGPWGIWRAFRTAPNQPINEETDDLGTLGGDKAIAGAINSSGWVVGWSELASGSTAKSAFLYRDDHMIDLNTLIPAATGWELNYATDINGAGQIVGTGYINGQKHGYLLTQVPEPSSVILLGLGALGLLSFAGGRRVWQFALRRAADDP